MSQMGPRHPITVASDPALLAGRHRLQAVKRLGWHSIPATFLDGDSARRELITVDENLRRKPLNRYDDMIALVKRKQIYEESHPETCHGGRRTAGRKRDGAKAFAADMAEKRGCHKDSVNRLIRIGRRLIALPTGLRAHPLVNNMKELELLSRQDQEVQKEIVGMLESGEADTVRKAMAARNGPKRTNEGGNGEAWASVDWTDHHDRPEVQDGAAPSCSNGNGVPAGKACIRSFTCQSSESKINACFETLLDYRRTLGGPKAIDGELQDLWYRFRELRVQKAKRDGPEVLPLPRPLRWQAPASGPASDAAQAHNPCEVTP